MPAAWTLPLDPSTPPSYSVRCTTSTAGTIGCVPWEKRNAWCALGGLVFAVGISRCSAIVAGMLATIPETADERVIGLINDGAWDASGGFPLVS